jgi:hypothetical protein
MCLDGKTIQINASDNELSKIIRDVVFARSVGNPELPFVIQQASIDDFNGRKCLTLLGHFGANNAHWFVIDWETLKTELKRSGIVKDKKSTKTPFEFNGLINCAEQLRKVGKNKKAK